MLPKGLNQIKSQLLPLISFFSWAVLFAIIYAQSPLYTSNQNQYFLHGMADAGFGFLEEDWLANSVDPTPIFSLLVRWAYDLFETEVIFYGIYALLFGVYLWSLLWITEALFGIRTSRSKTLTFLVLIFATHSAGMRYVLSRALGPEWTYVLEGGVAGQRLLGTVLQPSTFGVFLVLAIGLFLRGRIYPAVLAMIAAVYFHPTYLLSAAMLTMAFMWSEYREKGTWLKALLMGVTSLALVLPILGYVYLAFGASASESVARAREILVEIRIPHHAIIAEWMDISVLFQMGIVAAAIWLARKTALFPIMLILASLSLFLTTLQIMIGSDGLALLFPWRISVVLVPLSTALILAKSVTVIWSKLALENQSISRRISIAGMGLIVILTLVGASRFRLDWERRVNGPEMAMMDFVRNTRRSGEVYLVPTKMQDFRLETGAPIYIDFKSIPYAPNEVVEWRRRVLRADRFYREKSEACETLEAFAGEGITYVVSEAGDPVTNCNTLKEIYNDAYYAVFELSAN